MNQEVRVNSKLGVICGLKKTSKLGTDYISFQGIPFAKPPVGELRFKDPVAVEPWKETLYAHEEKPVPPYLESHVKDLNQSEDCLYLNVYGRNLTLEKKFPVMVFMYGGGFVSGSSASRMYGFDYLAEEKVILVTFNYRLCIYGNAAFKDPSLGIPGNAFLKDQRLALKWVKDNIDAFGGDAENITIFGHSAGGCSVHHHLLSPSSAGLFNRAIVMSGSALAKFGMIPLFGVCEKLAKNTGWNGENGERGAYEHLITLDTETLTEASKPETLLNADESFAFGPVIESYESEGSFCTKPPEELAKTAWSNSIDVIFWFASNEILVQYDKLKPLGKLGVIPDSLLLPSKTKKKLNSEELKEALEKIKTVYNTKSFDSSNLQPAFDVLNDQYFVHAAHKSIEARVKYASSKTYLAYFNTVSDTLNHHKHLIFKASNEKGAAHGDELSYIFSNIFGETPNKDSNEFRNIRKLVNFLVGFATEGSKKCDELEWIAITKQDFPDNYKAMLIEDPEWKVEKLPEISRVVAIDDLLS